MLPTPEPPLSDATLAMIAEWDDAIRKANEAIAESHVLLASLRQMLAHLEEMKI